MFRSLVSAVSAVALLAPASQSAEAVDRAHLAKLAVDWLLFDDRGAYPAAGQPVPDRPLDERTAHIRAHLAAQPQVQIIFSGSDGKQMRTVYDVGARTLRDSAGDRRSGASALILSIKDQRNGGWKVKLAPSEGDGLSGPVAEIIQHSGGYHVRYAGFRIVCL